MTTLLHLIATPRGEASNTLTVSRAVLERFKERHPEGRVDTLDLFATELPAMTLKATDGKYRLLSGKELDDETRPAWEPILAHITRFKAADIVLISTPMWNFGLPYVLKHYFDVILQPRHLFQYTANGPEGLAKGKKVVVVNSRGGDYSEGPGKAMDHVEPPLRTMLGFVGIPDPVFLTIQPTLAGGPDVTKQKIEAALVEARRLAL